MPTKAAFWAVVIASDAFSATFRPSSSGAVASAAEAMAADAETMESGLGSAQTTWRLPSRPPRLETRTTRWLASMRALRPSSRLNWSNVVARPQAARPQAIRTDITLFMGSPPTATRD